MALREKRQFIINEIKSRAAYLQENHDLYMIHEGNLLPFVQKVMQETLSTQYYEKIKSRISPINILKRYIDKISKAYINSPVRTTGTEALDEIVRSYEQALKLDVMGAMADRYANLFKGYAWEIYIHEGVPKLRTIPFDRFWVISEDRVDPLNETIFIKFCGSASKQVLDGQTLTMKQVDIYEAYTAEEVDSFDSEGDDYASPLISSDEGGMNGVNPYGVIPFIYGNRSRGELIPIQDTDLKPMTISIPITLDDLGGAIMFQCFSIIWTMDVDQENLVMSPNALWNLKSDRLTDTKPAVGTINPTVQINEVISYVMTKFVFWLETKGVRVNGVGSIDGANAASGIAKIIDEMDTFEIRKENISFFKDDEAELWQKLVTINNYWVSNDVIDKQKFVTTILPEDMLVTVEFDEPKPMKSYDQQLKEVEVELKLGTMTKKQAIEELHPDWTPEQVEEVLQETEVVVNVEDQSAEGNNPDQREVLA